MPEDILQETKTIEDINCIREWLQKQQHLPQNIDDQFLLRFLHSSNDSIEKAKYLIDLCFTLRSEAPEIFSFRDPDSKTIANVFDAIDFVPLPKATPERYKVFIYRLRDGDADKFQYADSLKVFFMVADVRMASENAADTVGEVPIFDMAHVSLRHLTKIALPVLRKYMVYTQEAHPVRLKMIHVVNANAFMDRCMALVRPFLRREVAQLLHFHQPGSHTLFDYVDRELVPAEYGGTLPLSLDQMKEEWVQRVRDHRQFFLDERRWRVDESKRPQNSRVAQHLLGTGLQGSFRALNID